MREKLDDIQYLKGNLKKNIFIRLSTRKKDISAIIAGKIKINKITFIYPCMMTTSTTEYIKYVNCLYSFMYKKCLICNYIYIVLSHII